MLLLVSIKTRRNAKSLQTDQLIIKTLLFYSNATSFYKYTSFSHNHHLLHLFLSS
ncbi:hypothetical protein HanIR_Chr15g0730141 [Helianthus annuus]|nr:hypothetical protein HanIR_Chr15g0730141 [Helianthus annuus]